MESVDQSELMRLMNDLPDLDTLQMDLAAINARTVAVRDDMNQVKTDQEQHELKISDRINEVGARIGTQLNAQRHAVDQATKLAKDAVAHNKGFVSSDEFDHVLNTIERQMRRNMTTIGMKLEHRATVANRLDARIAGIESKVTDAAEASENAQEVAQSLLTTVQARLAFLSTVDGPFNGLYLNSLLNVPTTVDGPLLFEIYFFFMFCHAF